MKKFYLLCLTYLVLSLSAEALTRGMTVKAVEAELGKPTSRMELADRTILIYPDQRKLEFESGKLIRENGLTLDDSNNSLLKDSKSPNMEIELPVTRTDMTITESYQSKELTADDIIGENYSFGAISGDLTEAIQNYEHQESTPQATEAKDHIRDVLIGFILEVVLTCIVLQVAFSLSGFPALFRQLALLSLAVALVGAILDYALSIGLFNPIRIGVSFIMLLILIRQMTDVREWATAIRIALLARFISLGLMWVSFAGLMVLFGL